MAADQAQRVLHIADSPNDTRLLDEQLRQCGIRLDLERVGGVSSLRAAMLDPPAMLVVDLPIPWAEADLLAIRATHPRLPVVFRWGHPGNWHVDDPCEQIGRAVAKALELTTTEFVSRLADIHQEAHLRLQRALLELGKLDYWDFAASLQRTTETVSELLRVERVSTWELGSDGALTSLDLFTAPHRQHSAGTRLEGFPQYRRLLEESVALASSDATKDSRFEEFAGWYLEANGITSMLDMPIRKNGRVVGVLCIEHTAAPRTWTAMEQNGAAAIAHLIGCGMETRDRIAVEANLARARKAEALGKIAAQLAHDFNNRLTVITLLVDQLQQEATTASQHDASRQLSEELARARDKVRSLLAGRSAQPDRSDVTDLTALIAREQPTLRRLLAPHMLHCMPPDGAVLVAMPAADLREVLTNLVTNARDAMTGTVGTCTIRLNARADSGGAFATLTVEDNGHGMSKQTQDHLFEPFFTTKGNRAGSGIGLPSVQVALQRVGGRVQVHTQSGKGTTIELSIPLTKHNHGDALAG